MLAVSTPVEALQQNMARGDESDEEVYLSDPPSDDDSSSLDDYEYSAEAPAAGDYEKAVPQQEPEPEIDWTEHDAEVSRAAALSKENEKKAEAEKEASSAEPNSSGFDSAASDAPASAHHGSQAAKETSEAAQPESKNPHSIIGSNGQKGGILDMGGMMARIISANSSQAQNGSKTGDEGSDTRDEPTAASVGSDKPGRDAQDVDRPSTPMRSEVAATSGETPVADMPSTSELAAQLPGTAAAAPVPESVQTGDGAERDGDKVEASEGSKPEPEAPSAPASSQGNDAEPVSEAAKPLAELPSTAAAAPVPEGVKSAEEEHLQEEGMPAESSKAQLEQKRPASAMPTLPDRRKKGGAMPSLPARTPRRQEPTQDNAGPSSSEAPANQSEQPSTAPAASESGSESQAASTSQEPAPAPAVAGPRPAGGDAQVRAPDNGQTGPITVQRTSAANPARVTPREPESEETKQKRAKLRDLRITLQRVAGRLGTPEHSLVKQIKYRLEHAERVTLDQSGTSEDLAGVVRDLEAENGDEDLLQITALVVGITGTGKSASINSLLGYNAVSADAFNGTSKISVVEGGAFGLKLRLIDTPGLHPASGSQRKNEKILAKINRARSKHKPDLVIYCERLDMMRRDMSDIPLLRQLSETLGSEMWFSAMVLMTHATAQGPLTPEGNTLAYESQSQMRAQLFQRAVQGAIGDHRVTSPTAFAENSPSCPRNADGEAILPDGTVWRKFVMLYMAVMKILARADDVLQVGTSGRRGEQSQAMSQLQMLFQGQRAGAKLPPLPFLVTNMIKHAGPKLYPDVEREIMRPDEIKTLKRFSERRAEARKRIEYLKAKHIEERMLAYPSTQYGLEDDPTEQPGMAPQLPPSFGSENTSHLYRSYEPKPGQPGWLTRMRMEQNVVDHTDGVESLTTERSFVQRKKGQHLGGIPIGVHAIIQKDKNDQMFQGGAEASVYQTYKIVHTGRLQALTMSGSDVLYISQLETHLAPTKTNRLTLGGLISKLGDDSPKPAKDRTAIGMKLEDEMELPRIRWENYKHSAKAGIGKATVKFSGRKEAAIGANAEYQIVAGEKENIQVVASFSQMKYRGNKGREYALSAAVPVTAETTAAPKLQLRSGKQGSLSVNITSHDHPNIGLFVLYPLGKALVDRFRNRSQ